MSAQSRANRRWPVGRIELEGMTSQNPVRNSVLSFALLLVCAAALRIARIVLANVLYGMRPGNHPLQLVLRYARRLRLFFHFTFARLAVAFVPLVAALEMAEKLNAVLPTQCVAPPTHNSFPPGFAQFFATFAAVPCG
jgi:hypothetical protein